MGEAPESGGEIEGHRESLRGQHPLLHQGERTRRPAKEGVVAFRARLMDTDTASPAGEATTPGPRRTINQREWTTFTGEPLRDKPDTRDRQFVERCGQACHTNRVSVTILEREMYTETAAARLLRVAPSTLHLWLEGRPPRYRPVIRVEPTGSRHVTWAEFVEASLLRSYRREHDVPLKELREFIDRLRDEFQVPLPAGRQASLRGPRSAAADRPPGPQPP
jgi:hypothetical protein